MASPLDNIINHARQGGGSAGMPRPVAPVAFSPSERSTVPLDSVVSQVRREFPGASGEGLDAVVSRARGTAPEAEKPGSDSGRGFSMTRLTEPLFDALSATNYAVAGGAREMVKSGDFMKALARAGREFANALPGIEVEGAERPGFSDVLQDLEQKTGASLPATMKALVSPGEVWKKTLAGESPVAGESSDVANAMGGFALDVLVDPLSIGGKALSAAVRETVGGLPAVQKAGSAIGESKLGRALGKAFSTDYELRQLEKAGELSSDAAGRYQAARAARRQAVEEGEEAVLKTAAERVAAGVPSRLDVAVEARQGLQATREAAGRRFRAAVLSDPEIARRVEDVALLEDPEFSRELAAKGYGILRTGDEAFVLPRPILQDLGRGDQLFKDGTKMRQFVDSYSRWLTLWKNYALLSPSWHIRNTYGNAANNFLAGIDSAAPYLDAMKLQKGKLVDVSVKLADGAMWSGEDILKSAEDLGVVGRGLFRKDLPVDVEREILNDASGNLFRKIFGTEGTILSFNRWVGDKIESNARLAHYLHKLRKGLTPEQAAASVQKYLFNYDELAPFEKDVMRSLIPFYTWMRKNIPLQLEAIATDPGRYAVFPKFKAAVERLSEDPPGEEPEYFDELSAVRMPPVVSEAVSGLDRAVFEGRMFGTSRRGQRTLFLNPSLPFQDLNKMNWRGIVSSLSPVFRLIPGLAPERGQALYRGRAAERFETPGATVLPEWVPGRAEEVLEDFVPPIGRVFRNIRKNRKDELGFNLASDLFGVRLMPAGKGKKPEAGGLDAVVNAARKRKE